MRLSALFLRIGVFVFAALVSVLQPKQQLLLLKTAPSFLCAKPL